jgi:vacuolar-type H+-ATPase subunit I/STV1
VLKTNRELKTTTDSNNTSEREMKREKKIRKLERRLSGLSKTIRELEEKDMSLAEMEHCDLYSVEANLKKQACEVS